MGSAPDHIESWYGGDQHSQLISEAREPAKEAYKEAVSRFSAALTQDERKRLLVRSVNSLDEVQSMVHTALTRYTDRKSQSKAAKWLGRLSSRINFYGNIMDVLVQHHPEYVSLAWGAFKFLFLAVQNHETVLALLTKALSRIADALPRVEFYSLLYPTARMRIAVEELFAHLLRFFVRGLDWCQENTFFHIIHSITRPPELRYKDTLEQIDELSRRIDQLALTASQAEIRTIHNKLNSLILKLDAGNHDGLSSVLTKLENNEKSLMDLGTQLVEFQALNSSAAIDTNKRLTDLQFSDVLAFLSSSLLGDPMTSYQYHVSMSKRSQKSPDILIKRLLCSSNQIAKWSTSDKAELMFIKGSFKSRHALRNFCTGIIEQLRESQIPCMWAFKSPFLKEHETGSGPPISSVDILKHITMQALTFPHGAETEKTASLTCSRFRTATSGEDWITLLGSALERLRGPIYIIIDLEVLNHSISSVEDFKWAAAFLAIFQQLSIRGAQMPVKVLLVGYGYNITAQLRDCDSPNLSIPSELKRGKARKNQTSAKTKGRETKFLKTRSRD
ncbi:hypothetical protein HD806DRAFT_532967 [Xylariaceae sp. AK1471]|nr:hypothetical protein HD806DRAFT_532967 [Xylariaceae sp. AK1471]